MYNKNMPNWLRYAIVTGMAIALIWVLSAVAFGANAVPLKPGTVGPKQFESGDTVSGNYGGMGIDTSGSTGVPSVSSGTWSIGASLGPTLGGTGIASYSTYEMIYASASNTLSKFFSYNANPANNLPSGSSSITLWPDGTTVAPFGWTAVLTPTIAQATGRAGCGPTSAGAVTVTGAGAANEGISITLSVLKPSTTYAVSGYAYVTTGDTASITTTGGSSNVSTSVTATSYTLFTGTFATDSTPTNVVLNLLASADTDVATYDCIQVTESPVPAAFAEGPMTGANRLQARGYVNTAYNLPSLSWTTLPLDAETYDPVGKYNTGTYIYTPGEDGWYLACGAATLGGMAAGKGSVFRIVKNTATVVASGSSSIGINDSTYHYWNSCSDVFLDEDDTIKLQGYNYDDDAGTEALINDSDATFLSIHKID